MRIQDIIDALPEAWLTAGGGAANTAKIFCALGGRASFVGAIGQDVFGDQYENEMRRAGVDVYLQRRAVATGVFCALRDGAGRRSIVVDQGAASSLELDKIPASFYAVESILYIDGFLAMSSGLLEGLILRAKSAGMKIAFDTGGHRLVSDNVALFSRIIREDCAWSFLNEDEFTTLVGTSVDAGLAAFSAEIPGVVVVKRADAGAVCVSEGRLYESSVRPIDVVDETGAGDAFAAGFLYAALSGVPLARCLRAGNWTAERAIQVPGMALDLNALRRGMATVL